MIYKLKNRTILTGCVALSLLLHIVSVVVFQRHSAWFPVQKSADADSLIALEKFDGDQILKQAFRKDSSVAALPESTPIPEKSGQDFTLSAHLQPIQQPKEFPPIFPPYSLESKLLANHPDISFSIPVQEKLNLFEHLSHELIIPIASNKEWPSESPTPNRLSEGQLKAPALPALREAPPAPLPSPEIQAGATALAESAAISKPPSLNPSPLLPNLPTLQELQTSSLSEFFETEITFLPIEDGYLFALTLIPGPDLKLPKIKQHISFLIDRSNSVQKERLAAARSAVQRALEELDPEDCFNIITFDSKIDKLFPTPAPASAKSIESARQFLDQITLGSFFSPSNLFKPLYITIPAEIKDDELHTNILLTDGESLGKKPAQRALAYEWTYYNSGRVSLYSIGLGSDPHLSTLDFATSFNKGKTISAPSKRGIKRKLLKLMKTISNPVAKNLSSRAIQRSPNAKIQLFPRPAQMPNLFLHEPYVILGKTTTLEPFILFVQGRLANKWFNIKKNVTFANAKKGGGSLKVEWALQQAYEHYERYLFDNDNSHLHEAHLILEPHNLRAAFQ
jgi:hypothetical protein